MAHMQYANVKAPNNRKKKMTKPKKAKKSKY